MTGVLIKGKDLDTDMHRERMCRREITAMHLQTKDSQKKKKKKECQDPQQTVRAQEGSMEQIFPCSPWEKPTVPTTLDF